MKSMFASLTLVLLSFPVHAEQAVKFGDIEIHYNAMPTDEMVPEVAKSYKIERSRKRGMLTISVFKHSGAAAPQGIKAKVDAKIALLTGQSINIPMREIVEDRTVYYIGEYRVRPPETVKFVITTRLDGGKPLHFDFSRQFY